MTKALEITHSKNIIHCDIKPANFLFQKNYTTKLIDFGLASAVSRKSPSISCITPIGTYAYISLEATGRIKSQNVDFRSDIYSLGISFYELITGKQPFLGDKLAIVHSQITKKMPNISGVPKILNDVIQKMASKNPSDRYYSCTGVVKDLNSF